jgi:hypothetical protein
METSLLLISVNYMLIARCLGAIFWGILYAVWLQNARLGQFLVEERTWVTVVIGVGVDMLLGIGALWWEIWLIVALSGIGIIARSLINERDRQPMPNGNSHKVKWGMEDAMAALLEQIRLLEGLLSDVQQVDVAALSQVLGLAHRANDKIRAARQGGYYGQQIRRGG